VKISITWELSAFFLMLGEGIIQGVVFDLFRAVRKNFFKGFWAVGIFDILYWAAAALIFAIFISWISFGEIRLFMLVGLILGLIFYFLLFSKTIIRLLEGIFLLFLKIFKFFFKILLTSGQFFYKILLIPFFVWITSLLQKIRNRVLEIFRKQKSRKKNDKKEK